MSETIKPLDAREQLFKAYYLESRNAEEAAIKAGYAKSTARKKAPMWVAKDIDSCPKEKRHLWAAIHESIDEMCRELEIDAKYLLKRLYEDVEADLADLYFATGSLKPVHDWPKVWRQGLVAGIETEQQYAYKDGEKVPDGIVAKVKLVDRTKLKQLLGNHVDVRAFKEMVESVHKYEFSGIDENCTPTDAADAYKALITKH